MGASSAEIDALARTAEGLMSSGQAMKALVLLKRLADEAPDHPAAQRVLAAFHPLLQSASSARPRRRAVEKPSREWSEKGAPLAAIDLARVMKAPPPRPGSDIVEIVLESAEDERTALVERPVSDPQRFGFGTVPLFAALEEASFHRLMRRLRIVAFSAGEAIFRQGSRGGSMYILSEGSVRVLREKPQRVELARLHAGEFFGEISLLTDHPRNATVEALERCELIEIDRRAITDLVSADETVMPVLLWFLRDRLVETLIRTSQMFAQFPHDKRRRLADRFRLIETQKSGALILQGQRAPGLIVVLSGRAEVYRSFGKEKIVLAKLGPGDICGEMSLLTGEPAVANVVSEDHFIGLYLSENDFQALVTEHPFLVRVIERIAEERRQKLVAAIDDASFGEGKLPLI